MEEEDDVPAKILDARSAGGGGAEDKPSVVPEGGVPVTKTSRVFDNSPGSSTIFAWFILSPPLGGGRVLSNADADGSSLKTRSFSNNSPPDTHAFSTPRFPSAVVFEAAAPPAAPFQARSLSRSFTNSCFKIFILASLSAVSIFILCRTVRDFSSSKHRRASTRSARSRSRSSATVRLRLFFAASTALNQSKAFAPSWLLYVA